MGFLTHHYKYIELQQCCIALCHRGVMLKPLCIIDVACNLGDLYYYSVLVNIFWEPKTCFQQLLRLSFAFDDLSSSGGRKRVLSQDLVPWARRRVYDGSLINSPCNGEVALQMQSQFGADEADKSWLEQQTNVHSTRGASGGETEGGKDTLLLHKELGARGMGVLKNERKRETKLLAIQTNRSK